jgi:hypothetical protein
MERAYGTTAVPLTHGQRRSEFAIVREDGADAPDLVRCYFQQEPAHAPYDHCTVKYLLQAGVKPSYIRLADIGIHGNSHVMMLEKNNKEIAAVIAAWLAKNVND